MAIRSIIIARTLFNLAVLISCFLLGGLFALNQWQPFTFIFTAVADTQGLWNRYTASTPRLLEPIVYPGDGVKSYNLDKAYTGYTLLQGTMPGGPQVKLIDMNGNEIHRWDVNFFDIWPTPDHLSESFRPVSELYTHTQGFVALPDGSIIVNVGGKGSAKLDKCSNVIWTVNRRTHHSVTQTTDGNFWIPAHRDIEDIPEHLLFAGITKDHLNNREQDTFFGYENLILLIDNEGNILREFSMLEAIYQASWEAAVVSSLKSKPFDLTHINDIEIVTPALARKINNVNEGDLLISIRQMHMLTILDQFTGKIKWRHFGPWVSQHDPDITIEGNIVVFNNSVVEVAFNRPAGSNIVELDPATNQTRILYPTEDSPSFFTNIMGSHQGLENNNRLISESRAGRVFEVTSSGELVWQYILPYNNDMASLIAISQRVESDYFQVNDWQCEPKQQI
ncbi:arylsulfotransferase family protein [Shewanella sp. UCD-KL12]|uniref:arylsulfotransferase family protein n=1 Tax=Shewanella sp. UCD-KL12 TaxID=1917163 RepID=UPI0009704B78|nr:arylsulfotransferase family protein [Shewanella sp. UCD-KL12]